MVIQRLKTGACWALAIAFLCYGVLGCGRRNPSTITVYASQDQVYAEPLLRQFTERTGIPVQAIYDSEAVKTVGLANRLLAERPRPLADVYWSNDELRTRQLAAEGVFRQTNGWASFGQRSRIWVVQAQWLAQARAVPSLIEITNSSWRGKVALASPLFGSTATHFCVLRQRWGDKAWKQWCDALSHNEPLIVEGNSMVVRMVARGQALIGLTDSDDVAASQREGSAVRSLSLGLEGWRMPNTVAVIRGSDRGPQAQHLMEYLLSREVELSLQHVAALEARTGEEPSLSEVSWDRLLRELPETTDYLRAVFLN